LKRLSSDVSPTFGKPSAQLRRFPEEKAKKGLEEGRMKKNDKKIL
jgi:hypothetical protein